jgi:glucose-6-phosphate isomerase
MNISYFDDARVTEKLLLLKTKSLQVYRQQIVDYTNNNDLSVPEASLYYAKNAELHELLAKLKVQYKSVKRVVLIGIGGSSLGTEAVHAVLDKGKVALSVIDTVSVSKLHEVRRKLAGYKKVTDVAVCVISKSGNTTETLANAAVILDDLKTKFGEAIFGQTLFIGNPGTEFMKQGKKMKVQCIAMPEIIGGRYSIATAVGLVPLTLLGHDVDEFIAGYVDASHETLESVVADSASRLAVYHQLKYPHYNFFAFETRLEKLGNWYRQLFAESLGKEKDKLGKDVHQAMVPAISTAVELHSVGQLYMSGVPAVYTDFVAFDDDELDVMLPKHNKLAPALKGFSLQEVATALYGGVIGAYQEQQLPYRATIFEEELVYSVGQFMAMRLREVMYTAHLLNLNAFDQPNVELYKTKTKEILFL